MQRAVFLDRDGVVNDVVLREGRPYPPSSVQELRCLPGVPQAVKTLRDAGFRIILVTNQPDVATGRQQRSVVDAIHASLRQLLPLDDIKVCYHVDGDGCACRKPKPGMLLEAARTWGLDLTKSVMVGDRWRDIEAGKAAGCKTILIKRGYAEQEAVGADAVVTSLAEASAVIVSLWNGSSSSRGVA